MTQNPAPPKGQSSQTAAQTPARNRSPASYANPILFADYSDPDAIRDGDNYWMTSSSFAHAPGLPILHSCDLINWTLVNHALPRLAPEKHYATHRAGCGVWAPSIRHHAGRFWIFFADPDFGIYVISAVNPAEQWTEPRLLKPGKGLIDPCPIWTQGKAYVAHGWAKSRSGICNVITLHEMSLNASELLDEGQTIIDGNAETDWHTIEGPKCYERDGWYWIFAPAGGVATGFQTVFRSRSIRGPYEARKVLEQGNSSVNGPHQGAWIDTTSGEHWFIHFQEKLPFGRIVHLQPMRWREDGWPVIGNDPAHRGIGEPVSTHQRPATGSAHQKFEYSHSTKRNALGLEWQWQANPQPNWLTDESSANEIGLRCLPRSVSSFWTHGPLLLQKLVGPQLEVSLALTLAADSPADVAGLIVFGYDYFWMGLVQRPEGNAIESWECRDAHEGASEVLRAAAPADSATARIRLSVDASGRCQFFLADSKGLYLAFGPAFQARESKWVGAKFGLFAANLAGAQSNGYANFKNVSIA